jgi:hypothetical protein
MYWNKVRSHFFHKSRQHESLPGEVLRVKCYFTRHPRWHRWRISLIKSLWWRFPRIRFPRIISKPRYPSVHQKKNICAGRMVFMPKEVLTHPNVSECLWSLLHKFSIILTCLQLISPSSACFLLKSECGLDPPYL